MIIHGFTTTWTSGDGANVPSNSMTVTSRSGSFRVCTFIERKLSIHLGGLPVSKRRKPKHRDLLNSQVAYSRLAGTRNIETRSKLRLEIRRRVERITFWFRRGADSPRLVEDPVKELFPFAEVRFRNGKCRYIVLTKGVIMTLPQSARRSDLPPHHHQPSD